MENTNTQQIWNTRRACGTYYTSPAWCTHKADDVMTWRVCFVAPAWLDSRNQSRWPPIVMTTEQTRVNPDIFSRHLIKKKTRNSWVDKTALSSLIGIHISNLLIVRIRERLITSKPTISFGSLDEQEETKRPFYNCWNEKRFFIPLWWDRVSLEM